MITQIKCPDDIYTLTSMIGTHTDYEYGFHLNTLNAFLFSDDGNHFEKMYKFDAFAISSMIFKVVIPHIVDEVLKQSLTNTQ
jgi:hypothetical protein